VFAGGIGENAPQVHARICDGLGFLGFEFEEKRNMANAAVVSTEASQLSYRCTNHDNIHVRGFKGEGTTTTSFDRVVLNELDRFHLVGDVIDLVPSLGSRATYAKQYLRDKLLDHKAYIDKYGHDMPEIRNWKWSLGKAEKRV
jgi:phosphoketolase